MLFAGSSHKSLAEEICKEASLRLGKMHLSRFPDQEIDVRILENVRASKVFVLQSIAGDPEYYLFELLLIVDALKREGAQQITAIIPYLGYCRQDRKNKPGVPISAKLIANMLEVAGISQLITIDLHAPQIEGFFDIPVIHVHSQSLFKMACVSEETWMVVAPDLGSIKIAEKMAQSFNAELAVIKKKRLDPSQIQMTLLGDVKHKNVLIVDDLCSTGLTLTAAAELCHAQGAQKIRGAVTHGLFSFDTISRIESSPLDFLFVTNSIAFSYLLPSWIKTISVARLIANVL